MNEDTLNMEIRKFLKKVGISSQREIEHVVQGAIRDGRLIGSESLKIRMTLELPDLDFKHQTEDLPSPKKEKAEQDSLVSRINESLKIRDAVHRDRPRMRRLHRAWCCRCE